MFVSSTYGIIIIGLLGFAKLTRWLESYKITFCLIARSYRSTRQTFTFWVYIKYLHYKAWQKLRTISVKRLYIVGEMSTPWNFLLRLAGSAGGGGSERFSWRRASWINFVTSQKFKWIINWQPRGQELPWIAYSFRPFC